MKRALAAASRTSQTSASCVPAPVTGPLTAATVGFSSRSSSVISEVRRWESWRNSRGSQSRSNLDRSPPALNALPSPVRIRARTSGSSAASSKAARSAAASSPSIALRRSGRARVTVRTPSSVSVRSMAPMLRSRTVFASYEHFLDIAASVQWDERSISLRQDARAWPQVADARVTELVAGFCVGEAGVAEHLAVFADGPAAACFAAQQRDERRHARFFARYAAAVGLEEPLAHVSDDFRELFEVRLPEAVAGVPGEAVGLYHMVLEGVVFTAGQLALLDAVDARLPGLREGAERVLRDERWHVGFGARCLADLDFDEAAILAEGERAAAVWAPEHAERVVAGLRSRLRAVRRQRELVH